MAVDPPSSRSPSTDLHRPTMPAAAPVVVAPAKLVMLGSGRSLAITEHGGEERLEIRSAGGDMVLSVRLTDAGPVFSLSGASFEITAARTLSLSAETLRFSALKDLTIESGGALTERAAGDAVRDVGGTDRTIARDVEVAAHPGGISLRANDDVDVVGERVRLNSDDPPMPRTWEEHRSRHALAAAVISQEALPSEPAATTPSSLHWYDSGPHKAPSGATAASEEDSSGGRRVQVLPPESLPNAEAGDGGTGSARPREPGGDGT